jgi:hypothetical protein
MSRHIDISPSVDPNTFVFDIHEEHRTRISVLVTRAEVESLCDKLRALLSDPPTVMLPSPKLAIFPTPEPQPMKVGIGHSVTKSEVKE